MRIICYIYVVSTFLFFEAFIDAQQQTAVSNQAIQFATNQGRVVYNQTPDIYHLNTQASPTIKLRIGNPTSQGLLVIVLSQANPSQIKSVQYAPPKFSVTDNISSYFSTVAEQYVLPSDLIGLVLVPPVPPVLTASLDAVARENSAVTAIKAQAEHYLKNGMLTIWRISRINAGTTKTYVYVDILNAKTERVADKIRKVMPGGIPGLRPNNPVQTGFLSEIDFVEWPQPPMFQNGSNRFIKGQIYLCDRFGTCSLDKGSRTNRIRSR